MINGIHLVILVVIILSIIQQVIVCQNILLIIVVLVQKLGDTIKASDFTSGAVKEFLDKFLNNFNN